MEDSVFVDLFKVQSRGCPHGCGDCSVSRSWLAALAAERAAGLFLRTEDTLHKPLTVSIIALERPDEL